ncbi:glycosyltransferase family 1 protein [Candidatus Enterococcus murrayae]|uniref:Glycosyltransferase family 1 protein n=1 Tax=Candidatus Enterococcus murrayae TaxID=2815321 RepID=A0ABS3HKN6_9ENTE|nr:glycosyltransferase family 1 protein [Enterococcus sp. MJM16]MBO0454017.1 glycosyltransferase family 1 protein [Enterococcus sp. MJM16]
MSKPVRILQVVNRLDVGGAETFIMNVYRQMDREKVQFDFIVHGAKKGMYVEEVEQSGGRIFQAPNFKKKHLLSYKKWWQLFFSKHPEYKIIHSHIRTTTPIIFYVARKNGLMTISHSHSTSNGHGIRQKVKGLSNYFTRNLSDFMFGCSDEAGKWMYGKKAIRSTDYQTLSNGIDLGKFRFDEKSREKIRTELNVNDTFLLGHVGRFAAVKNQRFLIELFPEILKFHPNTKLIFLGSGPLLEENQLYVNEKGLQDDILFLNKKSNINEYMMAMDLFLFPSLYEGLPLALIESQATGLRSVVSDKVTSDADLTGSISFCDITDKQQWLETIKHSISTNYPRNTQAEILRQHGYDIKRTATTLQELYLNLSVKE